MGWWAGALLACYAAAVFFTAKDAGHFSALSIAVVVVLAVGAVATWTGRRVGLWVGLGTSVAAAVSLLVLALRDGETSGLWLAGAAVAPALMIVGRFVRRPAEERPDRTWLWFLVFGVLGVVGGGVLLVWWGWPALGVAVFSAGAALFGALLGGRVPARWRVPGLLTAFAAMAGGTGLGAVWFALDGRFGGAWAFGLAAAALLWGLALLVVRAARGRPVSWVVSRPPTPDPTRTPR
ncbi:hypothetical protein [Saccharothrix variisporea]|uniref:Uncharacterized protein n=1 Tax=Saccharothrix variisporea TaxID=543527 RepID=A0A495X6K3_9PSEU|nr:hypothetical protein [Saccharothrix variisporea]RKT68293.1 hypothetical protein DFJ66_1476 [Saccharothrix variisporea]